VYLLSKLNQVLYFVILVKIIKSKAQNYSKQAVKCERYLNKALIKIYIRKLIEFSSFPQQQNVNKLNSSE